MEERSLYMSPEEAEEKRRLELEKYLFPFDDLTKANVIDWMYHISYGNTFVTREELLALADPYISKLFPLVCPEKGEFTAYKYACPKHIDLGLLKNGGIEPIDYLLKTMFCLVTLKIPEHAARLSGTSNKCRCDEAFVEKIELYMFKNEYSRGSAKALMTRGTIFSQYIGEVYEARSNYDFNFIYKTGEAVQVDDFDDNRWNECSKGIHFFMTKEEAIGYAF